MVKAYRHWSKIETRRYKMVKEKMLELGKKEGEITSSKFTAFAGFSANTSRTWLARFETDGIIKLNRVGQAGEKVYVIKV